MDGKVVWTGSTDASVDKASLPTVTRDGYTFDGWRTADGQMVSGVPATYAAGNVTYIAQWIENGRGAVSFVYDNGDEATIRTGLAGTSDRDRPPTDPVREGYTFAGWFDNAECSGDEDREPRRSRLRREHDPDLLREVGSPCQGDPSRSTSTAVRRPSPSKASWAPR